jgi:hypothetical protein
VNLRPRPDRSMPSRVACCIVLHVRWTFACFDDDHAGPLRSVLAQRAQMHATSRASGARRSSVSGAIAALKHQHRVAFGSAAIAQALGDEQSGQRLGSIGCAFEVMAEFTLRGGDRRSRCTCW